MRSCGLTESRRSSPPSIVELRGDLEAAAHDLAARREASRAIRDDRAAALVCENELHTASGEADEADAVRRVQPGNHSRHAVDRVIDAKRRIVVDAAHREPRETGARHDRTAAT